MILHRKEEDRGHVDRGWLDTYHTFSFASYHDPRWMGFRALRVINDDKVAPNNGFPPHDHRDMEIITYVLDGVVAHKDSMGNVEQIRSGEVQCMTAGAGIEHSEYNPSADQTLHLLQIWILPERKGIPPSYAQKKFSDAEKAGKLCLIVSHDGCDGSLAIHQDVKLYAAQLSASQQIGYSLAPQRHAWLQVARGAVELNGLALKAGDGAAVSDEMTLTIVATQPAEFLLFDLS